MKLKNLSWLVLGLGVLFAAGCSSTSEVADSTAGSGANTAGADAGQWSKSKLNDPSSPLYTKVIYFDYDLAELRSEAMDTLRAHSQFLTHNQDMKVTVEGHADERGSREYNIALGERRAKAVQRFFESQGVSPSQISTLSYGEERPAEAGHDESAWSMNRRAVLVY